ncbi:type 2 lanthipeptide synthetase LanM family protein [Paenibacillus polymyxa]|uniref:type 2 lanthipeptide synthetase LanM family protein n=1 Tax=Paenibacillus TaxID=44249 RepID=UPI002025AE46|nr:type 2 lanthipeptide synthetase LanM family protein [Paenibacillus polymyxa]URJ40138.3 type 2 lanthipeptide synthetase LanM family protein [Paenibacillus polymyxa]
MESLKYSYITEREYHNVRKETEHSDVYKYWYNILGEDIISDFEKNYNLNLNVILSSDEYKVHDFTSSTDIADLQKLYFNKQLINAKSSLMDFDGKEALFFNFYIPFITIGLFKLNEKVKGEIEQCVKVDFSVNMLEQLNKISVGTLIFEMHLSKKNNELRGENAREEYLDYNNRFLKDQDYVTELMEIYPCLCRMIFETIMNHVDNYSLALSRLKKDHNLIVQNFCRGNEFTHITAFNSSMSDSHQKGKTVIIFTLDNDVEIVYKPRNLKIDMVYHEFLMFISSSAKHTIKDFKITDCGEYGWEEFVSHTSCSDNEALNRYYYRFGVLIFTHFILGSNDLHKENLIAAGEHPVIIDAETLLNNKKEIPKDSARGIINNTLRESVLYSGLLPQRHFIRKGEGIDLSAAKGKENVEYPVAIPRIAAKGTSDMHFVYEHPKTKLTQNLPTINGDGYSISGFVNQVISGFKDVCMFVLQNKQETLEKVNLFVNLKVRHLVQDTQRYYLLLHTSYHPDFLQDAKDRHLLLGTLFRNWKDVHNSCDITKMEIADMLNMDVPYFYIYTDKRSLFGNNDKEIKDYFPKTSMECLNEKIANLSNTDLEEQLRYIRISLTNINDIEVVKEQNNFTTLDFKFGEQRDKTLWLKAVLKIADGLLEKCVMNKDKSDVNWIDISAVGKDNDTTWDIRPLNTYLYDGLTGIAIFFNALNKLNPCHDYSVICNALKNALFLYTDEMCDRSTGLDQEASGAFSGEGSLLYTYEILYSITGNEAYLNYAKKHVAVVSEAIIGDKGFDICFGNAGAILALLNLYKLTKDKRYLEEASKAGYVLLENQQQGDRGVSWVGKGSVNPLAGFSHGISGIAFALGKLGYETNNEDFSESALSGLQFENSLYDQEHHNWKDERVFFGEKSSDQKVYMTAWCHGAAGILLGRSKMYPYFSSEQKQGILQDMKLAVNTTVASGLNQNECLCHGNLGNTEILQEYNKLFPDNKLQDLIRASRSWVVRKICNGESNSSREYLFGHEIPGFMTGLAGMGYSLLRDLDDSLPCVLALDI